MAEESVDRPKSFFHKYHIPLTIGTIGAIGVLSIGSFNGAYGKRENVVESFHYKGEPAALIHEDVNWDQISIS